VSGENQPTDDVLSEHRHEPSRASRQHRSSTILWPVVLITAGVLLLLTNLGYLSASTWNLIWRFWPVILIALGVDVLIGRRSTLGTIISAAVFIILAGGILLLVILAPQIPALNGA